MYNIDRYNSSTTFDNGSLDSFYFDSLPYTTYNTNSYSFRQQTHSASSNVYFSSDQPSTSMQINPADVTTYANNDITYQNNYYNDSIDMNFSRHINNLYTNNIERKTSTTMNQTGRKRKFQDETIKSQYESELCRVCDDLSSGYHFGVFTCEACKGFFRRYSKKSTILEPCPIRCPINKNNRNNCAACRFDKCKNVGMALDKIRFGKPPKVFRSSLTTSTVKLEPNNNDYELMLKLLECYQSFEEYEQQPTTNINSSIIFQFCQRLTDIVMKENERIPETFLARLKRHESTIQFLITGENNQYLTSSSSEPQAWIFAHNERWRLIMILLILAFDDEQINTVGSSNILFSHENLIIDTVMERILRLFELECDQEQNIRSLNNEKNVKYMKAQFLLRFIDMMSNDMIKNRFDSQIVSNNLINSYFISDENIYRNTNHMIYLSCDENLQINSSNEIFE